MLEGSPEEPAAAGWGVDGGRGRFGRNVAAAPASPGLFYCIAVTGHGRRSDGALLRMPSSALSVAKTQCQAMPNWEGSSEPIAICFHRGRGDGLLASGAAERMRSTNRQLKQSVPR